jgi:tRNA nucleotidyltransferase/poly(A) polymerase
MAVFSETCGRTLQREGIPAYYAFSTARAMLLRKKPFAVNILTTADLSQLARLFPELQFRKGYSEHAFIQSDEYEVRFFSGDFAADRPIAIPGLTDENREFLMGSLKWEPFRTNAFFYSLDERKFLDPLDGYGLLKSGDIQTVQEPAHALRQFPNLAVLALRARAETGFELAPALLSVLENGAALPSLHESQVPGNQSDIPRERGRFSQGGVPHNGNGTGEHVFMHALKTLAAESSFGEKPSDTGVGAAMQGEAHRSVYSNPNPETVAAFIGALTARNAYDNMVLLDRWGILRELLPEVDRLKQVEQDKDHHPEGNAFWHTLSCLRYVKKPNPNLMIAIMLHDTGKAVTRSNEPEQPFPNHSKASRAIAEKVLDRFGLGGADREEILFMIEHHMILNRIASLQGPRRYRILSSPYFPNLLQLFRADIESGFHRVSSYHNASRVYRAFKRELKSRA